MLRILRCFLDVSALLSKIFINSDSESDEDDGENEKWEGKILQIVEACKSFKSFTTNLYFMCKLLVPLIKDSISNEKKMN
jgi:hypothetical protein